MATAILQDHRWIGQVLFLFIAGLHFVPCSEAKRSLFGSQVMTKTNRFTSNLERLELDQKRYLPSRHQIQSSFKQNRHLDIAFASTKFLRGSVTFGRSKLTHNRRPRSVGSSFDDSIDEKMKSFSATPDNFFQSDVRLDGSNVLNALYGSKLNRANAKQGNRLRSTTKWNQTSNSTESESSLPIISPLEKLQVLDLKRPYTHTYSLMGGGTSKQDQQNVNQSSNVNPSFNSSNENLINATRKNVTSVLMRNFNNRLKNSKVSSSRDFPKGRRLHERSRSIRRSAPSNSNLGSDTYTTLNISILRRPKTIPNGQGQSQGRATFPNSHQAVAGQPADVGTIPIDGTHSQPGASSALRYLYIKHTGRILRILPDGTVRTIDLDNCDGHCIVRLVPINDDTFKIKGEQTQLYLAMDENGRLYTTPRPDELDTNFIHEKTNTLYDTYESRHHHFLTCLRSNQKKCRPSKVTELSDAKAYVLDRLAKAWMMEEELPTRPPDAKKEKCKKGRGRKKCRNQTKCNKAKNDKKGKRKGKCCKKKGKRRKKCFKRMKKKKKKKNRPKRSLDLKLPERFEQVVRAPPSERETVKSNKYVTKSYNLYSSNFINLRRNNKTLFAGKKIQIIT